MKCSTILITVKCRVNDCFHKWYWNIRDARPNNLHQQYCSRSLFLLVGFFSSVYVLSRLVVLPLRFVFHLFFLFRLNYTLRSLVSYNVHRTDTRWIRTKQQQKIRPKRNYCCLFYVNYIHLLCKSIWSWFSCFLFILRLPHLRWSCDELVDGHWLCSGAMRVFTHTFRYLEI